MDRYWLITWTCYGTSLPGAQQGFVSRVPDERGNWLIHNIPGTPYDADMPALEAFARSKMAGPPVQPHAHRRRRSGRSRSAIDPGNVEELGHARSAKTSSTAAQRHVLDRQGLQAGAARRGRSASGGDLCSPQTARSAGGLVSIALAVRNRQLRQCEPSAVRRRADEGACPGR